MARRSVILKRAAIGVGVVLVLLVILIALLPMLISAGLGHGAVRGAIEDSLADGSRADFQSLSVTWRGPQEIRGLRIVDPQGEEVANVNASIAPGVWGLLFGTVSVLEANVTSGTVNVVIREDGTTNMQELIKTDPASKGPMEGVPALMFRTDDVDINLTHVADQRTVTLADLTGHLSYSPAAASASELEFDFTAQTLADDVTGRLRLAGRSENLFDADGAFTPANAPLDITIDGENIPVPGMDVPTILTQLAVAVRSDNLAQAVAANIESNAQFQTQDEPDQPSRFRAQINVRVPFKADGSLDVTLENITAEATGERVPSALLQPMLAGTPIVLSRDIGRTIDLDAQVDPAQGAAVIHASGPRGTLDVTASHDAETGWWTGSPVVIATEQAHPDLVRGFTNLNADRPVNLEIHLTELLVPPVDPQTGSRPFSQYGLTGTLRINEPVGIMFGEDGVHEPGSPPRSVLVGPSELHINAPSLAEYINLHGDLQVENAPVQLQQRITNLFNQQGEVDPLSANFVGSVTANGLPTAAAAQWLPDYEQTLRELLGEQLDLTINTTVDEDNTLRGSILATGEQTRVSTELLRRADTLEIAKTEAEFTLTPALVEQFRPEPEDADQQAITLLEQTPARFELDSFTLAGEGPGEYRLEDLNLRGRLFVENAALANVPGTAEPLSIFNVDASLLATLARDPFAAAPEATGAIEGDEQPLLAGYSVEGAAGLRLYPSNARLATARYTVNGRPLDESSEAEREPQLNGTLALTEVDVANVERLLGREPQQLALWLGESGAMDVQFSAFGSRYEATLDSEMPRLQGSFVATYADELLDVSTEGATLNLGANALAQLLGDQERVAVESDVPGTLVLDASIPLGLLTQQSFEPTLFDLSAELRGGPLTMRIDGQVQSLDNVVLTMTGDAFTDAAEFTFAIEGQTVETAAAPARPPGVIGAAPGRDTDQQPGATAGSFSVNGSLHEPLTAGEPITFDNSTLNLTAQFNQAPTALADAFLQMRGHLVAIVGASIDGPLEANDLTRRTGTGFDSGTVSMDLTSPNGFLRGSGIVREGLLQFTQENPIEGELQITPLMRDLVLSPIHPMFNNLLSAESPLTVTFAPASIPLDGDVSRLSGDINLNIGSVSLDRASPILGILSLAGVTGVTSDSVLAQFDPIYLQVRNGVIEYDRFITHIGSIDLPWQGTIDLVARQVNLRTVLPLSQLRIRELQDILGEGQDAIEVPLVLRGALGAQLEPAIDPEFDLARALLQRGIERNLLDRIFDRNGQGNRRNPLRDIFGPRRDN